MRINNDAADILPEDIYNIALPDSPSVRLTTEEVLLSNATPISVKYDYIDMGKTAYGFNQQFTAEDTAAYFERMKFISSKDIDTLRDRHGRKLHLYRSDLRGNLRKAVKEIFPKHADDMILYHFALYTSEDTASRQTGTRSPRIYFMHGTNGFIYPLFFDPYHELNPMVKL